jgi:hypothetical protein
MNKLAPCDNDCGITKCRKGLDEAPCSVPTAAELLERAHDMLGRAHVMLDGWQQAIDWHNDYERFKTQNTRLCKVCRSGCSAPSPPPQDPPARS